MSNVQIPVYIKSMEVEAKVIRANGDIEDLGTIASFHRNTNFFKKALSKLTRR